jgi:fermentation-respiration switch protein FrsA (DUF1100 family)
LKLLSAVNGGNKMIILILVMVLIIFIFVNSASIIAFKYITFYKRRSLEECFSIVEKDGIYSRSKFDELDKEEVEVMSDDGLTLRGLFIEKFKDSKKIIVIVHGYNLAYPKSLCFVEMFFKEGFNVLLVDQRGHGRSEGWYATYGYYEKFDLDCWVNWGRSRIGKDAVIGLHGQSMGGATALEYASINKHVKFIIADCPYSDTWELMKHQFRKLNHVPVFPFAFAVDHRIKKKVGFSFKDVSPIKSIKDKEIPVMFIHGAEDEFVPTYMSEEMFNIKQGYKKLVIIRGAEHANAYSTDRELYEREVRSFLKEVLN